MLVPLTIASISTYAISGFQDPVASLSHYLGAGVFAVMAIALLRRGLRGGVQGSERGFRVQGSGRAGERHPLRVLNPEPRTLNPPSEPSSRRLRMAALIVYCVSVVFLLSMSGTYHLLGEGTTAREVLRRLDHAAIFVLIAGTFTPPHVILFRGLMRWGPLLVIWTAAITGLTLKTIFFDAMAGMEWLGILFYLLMGWVGLFFALVLARRYGGWFIMPLLWGALAYTLGAAIETMQPPPIIPGVIGYHELFHFAVLVAAALHWKFIWQFADGRTPTCRLS